MASLRGKRAIVSPILPPAAVRPLLSRLCIATTPRGSAAGFAHEARPAKQSADSLGQLRPVCHLRPGAPDQNYVEWLGSERRQVHSNRLAQAPFYSVAHHGTALLLAYHKANAATWRRLRLFARPAHGVKYGDRVSIRSATGVHHAKVPVGPQPLFSWKHYAITDERGEKPATRS
jgi:hypothetical protein